MKRKMLCIILILIITTLFCGVSFASREGELKEGIGQKENEIEQIKKEKDEETDYGKDDTSIARYVWLPIRFEGDVPYIEWQNEWKI